MDTKRILVVDDEGKMRRLLELSLKNMGHAVVQAVDGEAAVRAFDDGPFDLVLTDLRMPRMDGIALLRALRERGEDVPVIVLTAFGSIESAVEAMKLGASDYIIRPFEMETVELAVARALALGTVQRENRFLRDEVAKGWGEFVGASPRMQELYHLVRQVAPTRSSVLIVGATGTGKELVARALHQGSGRSGLFVPINCAAIPADLLESELFGHLKGAFTGATRDRIGRCELASGGTLFLDEITEMPPALQAKLLRVLQEGTVERLGAHVPLAVDLRVVAATNRDPQQAVEDGMLRADLILPHQCHAYRRAVAARAPGGYSVAGGTFSESMCAGTGSAGAPAQRRRAGAVAGLRLAGQCARTGKHHGARGGFVSGARSVADPLARGSLRFTFPGCAGRVVGMDNARDATASGRLGDGTDPRSAAPLRRQQGGCGAIAGNQRAGFVVQDQALRAVAHRGRLNRR